MISKLVYIRVLLLEVFQKIVKFWSIAIRLGGATENSNNLL